MSPKIFSISDINAARYRDELPPGLLGEIAIFIFQQAPQPVHEVALAGALAYFAGIVGRQYNFKGDGLNLYVLLVAPTGAGKDAAKAGINRANSRLVTRAAVAAKIIGPADFASGPALVKSIARRDYPCFATVWGEVGHKLKQMADPRSADHNHSLQRELLKLFSLGARGRVLEGYEHSDAKLSTKPVLSPALTILGEGTPTTVYGALDENQISNGLISRFVILEYDGPIPPYNKDHASAALSDELLSKLESLFLHVQELARLDTVVDVAVNPDADELIDQIREYARATMNTKRNDVVSSIWTRVAQKVGRLAAQAAVATDYRNPVITLQMVEWAASIVITDARRMVARFQAGEMGAQDETDNARQIEAVRAFIERYLRKDIVELNSRDRIARGTAAITYAHIQQGIGQLAAFKHDRRGATNAIKATVKTLCEIGKLEAMLNRDKPRRLGDYRGEAYTIVDTGWFLGIEDDPPASSGIRFWP